jgi:glycosyltransferase involved in cell wall biosynthesis
MKKLAIYIPSIESGGVEKNLYNISEYFIKKKIEVYIVTANNKEKFSFNKKIKFICPRNKNWNNSSRLIKNFICLFLIIVNLPKKNTAIFSFQSNISAIILSKILGLKIIIRLNTSLNKYVNSYFKKLFFKLVYNMSDKIIVNSAKFKIELKNILNLNSVKILNPIDLKKISKKMKIKFFSNFKGIKIISIGRLTDQKDQIIILKSLDYLRKKNIRFKLFLIGKGSKLNELKQYVRNNQLLESVKFAGYKKDAFQYIASSDLFVLSSKFEGLPNVLIEAQSQNVPIISSDCATGPSEILLNGKLGTLYKVGDYIALSNAIINFYKNKQILKKKANLAKKYLYRFDYKKNLNKYYNTIKIIL